MYTTVNPGGCYKSGGHTHNKTGTCGTKYTTHAHTDACAPVRKNPMEVISRSGGQVHSRCKKCGRDRYAVDNGETTGWAIYECSNNACNYRYQSCSGTLNSGRTYTCGSPVNTWVIGCGKSTSSIDEAHIVFN